MFAKIACEPERVGICPAHRLAIQKTLLWRHNGSDVVSNHQPHDCLLNRLFGRRSKKTSKLRVTGLCVGNSPGPGNSPHKWPVTRKMFPFDDVIMIWKVFLTIFLCVMLWVCHKHNPTPDYFYLSRNYPKICYFADMKKTSHLIHRSLDQND